MIQKVIIAEDHESGNLSVQKTMTDLQIQHFDYVYYCDDALNKIKNAKQKDQPYDLLITDLLFDPDGTPQKIADGVELIKAARALQPELQVLVFTVEERLTKVKHLYDHLHIDGYIRKARHDVRELKMAMDALSKNQQYFPPTFRQRLKEAQAYVFTDFEITIIRLLAQGYQQNQMPDYLKKNNIQPDSPSSIEKHLRQLRIKYNYAKNQQLVLLCQKLGML